MLKAACRCGKNYQFKDDFAGRKFTCKACGKSLVIPGGEADDEVEARVLPPKIKAVKQPAASKKSAKPKLKRRSGEQDRDRQEESSDSNRSAMARFVVVGLLIAGVVGFFLSRKPNSLWREFTPPCGEFSLQIPSEAEREPARETAPAAECFAAAGRDFTCHISHFAGPAGVAEGQAPPNRIFDDCVAELKKSVPGLVVKSSQVKTVNDLPVQDMHFTAPDGERDLRIAYTGRGAAVLEFFYEKEASAPDRTKFFDSLAIKNPVKPVVKKNVVERMRARFVDREVALKENPNLVDTKNRITASDPLSTAGQGLFAATSQLSVLTMQHNIDIMKAVEDRNPTFAEMDKMLKDNNIEMTGLYPYQVYAYDAKTGTICVMEDPVEKERIRKEQGGLLAD